MLERATKKWELVFSQKKRAKTKKAPRGNQQAPMSPSRPIRGSDRAGLAGPPSATVRAAGAYV
jgi:hypothetical protein